MTHIDSVLEQINAITTHISNQINQIFFGSDRLTKESALLYHREMYLIANSDPEILEWLDKQSNYHQDTTVVMFTNNSIRLFNRFEIYFCNHKLNDVSIKPLIREFDKYDLFILQVIYKNFEQFRFIIHQYTMIYNRLGSNLLTDSTPFVKNLVKNFEKLLEQKIQIPIIEQLIEQPSTGKVLTDKIKNKIMFIRFYRLPTSQVNVNYSLFLEEHETYDGKYDIVNPDILRPDSVEVLKTGVIKDSPQDIQAFLIKLLSYGSL